VSGTLRNPPGTTTKTTMPRTQKPGTYRVEFLLTPEGLSRLKMIKKRLGLRNQNEVIEALLYKASGEQKIENHLTEEIAQNIMLILEKLDQIA
jgi:hypothetical protein